MMKSAWTLRYLLEKPCLLQKLPVFERPQGLEMSYQVASITFHIRKTLMWNSITATWYFSLLALLGPEEVELLQGNLVSHGPEEPHSLETIRAGEG